ncbi:hypothetical protein MASR1M90_16210 [Desulfovibrionales bacterium]
MAYTQFLDQVQKAYVAYYQRPADPGGQVYWAQRLDDTGGNLDALIDEFANSPEAKLLYGAITNATIGTVIDAVYQALFERPPDAEGREFYSTGFQEGRFSAGSIVLNILHGAQNEDATAIANKVAVANLFTRTIDPNMDGLPPFHVTYDGRDEIAARDWLALVTADPASVKNQDQVFADMKNLFADPGDLIHGADPGDPVDFNVVQRGSVYVFEGAGTGDIMLSISPDNVMSFTHQGVRAPTTIALNVDDTSYEGLFLHLNGQQLVVSPEQIRTIYDASSQYRYHALIEGTGSVLLNSSSITQSTNLTIVTDTVDMHFNNSSRVTVGKDSILILRPSHADNVIIEGEGRVRITLDYAVSEPVNLDIRTEGEYNQISGTSGADVLVVSGRGINFIEAGKGRDQITLGEGKDVVGVLYATDGQASYSSPGYGGVAAAIDIVRNFNAQHDKIQLYYHSVVDDGSLEESDGSHTYSVSFKNGFVTGASRDGQAVTDLDLKVDIILRVMGTSTRVAAIQSGNDYYLVQGNGEPGGQIGDVVVQLAGVQGNVEHLADIVQGY